MLNYVRLDGVDLHDYTVLDGARDVARIEGLVGLASPKGDSSPKSEQHGSNNRSRFQSSKLVSIEGECSGTTIEDAFAQFDEVVDAFERTLESGAKLLTWQRGGAGLHLQALCKLAGPVSPPLEEGAALLRYQAQLELMDPRAYSQTLDTVSSTDLDVGGGGIMFGMRFPLVFAQSSGGLAVVTNAGKIETPPVVRVFGPVTSASYVLDGDPTAGIVKLTGELAAGDYLEVDHAARTVKLNGQTLRMNLLNTRESNFFDIPRGVHPVRLLAQNFAAGAHIEVDTRSAYGG